MSNADLAIVMPVYNEQAAITNVLQKWTDELLRLGINFRIHVYNDGSKDNTLTILRQVEKENKYLIVHDKLNSGHGPTVLMGYRENLDAEWIFQIDSDDEISTEAFEDFWKKRGMFEFLIGRRIRDHQPYTRKVISLLSRLTLRVFYGNRVYDGNSPYRLMKTAVFKKLFFLLPDNIFAPNLVISGAVSLMKLNAYEIPVQQHERMTGEVSIRKMKLLKAACKSFYQTITFRFKIRKKNLL